MSRGSRHIWIAALATVPGCPPAPEGMTEPAWVRLAFEHTCHVSLIFILYTLNAPHPIGSIRIGMRHEERKACTLGCPRPHMY
jgi:hypothetical protein